MLIRQLRFAVRVLISESLHIPARHFSRIMAIECYLHNDMLQRLTQIYDGLYNDPLYFQKMEAEVFVRISLIVSGIIPLSFNIFAIVVLQRPQLRLSQPNFHDHMVLLTLSETLFCALFVSFWFFDVTFIFAALKNPLNEAAPVFLGLVDGLNFAARGTRNWVVAAVSVARCEAITRPLSSLSKKIMTTKCVRIFSIVTLFLTTTISLMLNFSDFWNTICIVPVDRGPLSDDNSTNGDNGTSTEHLPSVAAEYGKMFRLCYFFVFPIAIVIVSTIIMVVTIHKKKPALSQNQTNTQIRSTTVTLIGFTTLFLIFEGIGLAFYLLKTTIMGLSDEARITIYAFNKNFSLLKSMSNVIAYIAFSKTFRSVAKDILCSKEKNSR